MQMKLSQTTFDILCVLIKLNICVLTAFNIVCVLGPGHAENHINECSLQLDLTFFSVREIGHAI